MLAALEACLRAEEHSTLVYWDGWGHRARLQRPSTVPQSDVGLPYRSIDMRLRQYYLVHDDRAFLYDQLSTSWSRQIYTSADALMSDNILG